MGQSLYQRRMTPRRAAEHLVNKGYGELYASDREDSCRTDDEAYFWSRVGREMGNVIDENLRLYHEAAKERVEAVDTFIDVFGTPVMRTTFTGVPKDACVIEERNGDWLLTTRAPNSPAKTKLFPAYMDALWEALKFANRMHRRFNPQVYQ